MKIIAVTGWRNHTDGAFICGQLHIMLSRCRMLGEPLHVRVGDATGADEITAKWCNDTQDELLTFHVFRARRYPGGVLMPGAGPQRNEEMLRGYRDPTPGPTELLLGFPRTDGKRDTVPGSGTWGCCISAALMGIKVEIPAYRRSGE